MHIGMPMEDMLSAGVVRGDEGEVLRQASAVVGRPVVLWEIIGPHQAVPRASSGLDVGARPPGFDLDAILQRWSIPVPVGSRWVTAPGSDGNREDRKSTRLNSSHRTNSYAVFCLKKKNGTQAVLRFEINGDDHTFPT